MIGVDRSDSVTQIQADLGLTSSDSAYATVGPLWDAYASKSFAPWLQYHYTRRHAAEVMLGSLRDLVDMVDDQQQAKLHQRIDTVTAMRANSEAEIKKIEAMSASAQGGAVGQITTDAPVTAPLGYNDPNDRAYRGDPIRRAWPVR